MIFDRVFAQIDTIVCSQEHGPDTVERFEQFSMSAVISELQSNCPELYKLVQQLGSTQRNARDGARPDEELKAVMALCTLLNARSARTKGLQLMVSLMLVARATGRQVGIYTCTIRYAYQYMHVVYIHVQCMCLNSG